MRRGMWAMMTLLDVLDCSFSDSLVQRFSAPGEEIKRETFKIKFDWQDLLLWCGQKQGGTGNSVNINGGSYANSSPQSCKLYSVFSNILLSLTFVTAAEQHPSFSAVCIIVSCSYKKKKKDITNNSSWLWAYFFLTLNEYEVENTITYLCWWMQKGW